MEVILLVRFAIGQKGRLKTETNVAGMCCVTAWLSIVVVVSGCINRCALCEVDIVERNFYDAVESHFVLLEVQ